MDGAYLVFGGFGKAQPACLRLFDASAGALVRVLRGSAYDFDNPGALALGAAHFFVASSPSSSADGWLTEIDARTGDTSSTIRRLCWLTGQTCF
jgi:hypothetical protein